jgi:hypothetical protein
LVSSVRGSIVTQPFSVRPVAKTTSGARFFGAEEQLARQLAAVVEDDDLATRVHRRHAPVGEVVDATLGERCDA